MFAAILNIIINLDNYKINYLLGISLEDLQRVLQGAQNGLQGLSPLGDVSWLAQSRGQTFVGVDLVVKFKLEDVLRLSNQEVPNGLWNRVFNISKN